MLGLVFGGIGYIKASIDVSRKIISLVEHDTCTLPIIYACIIDIVSENVAPQEHALTDTLEDCRTARTNNDPQFRNKSHRKNNMLYR